MKYDCEFTKGHNRFRYRAAAIIIENNHVLFAGNERENYYYSIGGGVHIGETAENAVKREVFEETGIHYDIDRLVFIHENFFLGDGGILDGKKCHEIEFYFLMKSRGTQELKSNSYTHGVKENMYWIPISELGKYKAYPLFLRSKIGNMKNELEHIVTHRY